LELGDKKLIVQRAHIGTSNRLPMIEGALPGAGLGKAVLPIEILGANGLKPAEPTRVVLLLNLFDAPEILITDLSDAGDKLADEIVIDVLAECERFGNVIELAMPRPGKKGDPPVSGAGRVG
jgi:splicing factor U2AF subunit